MLGIVISFQGFVNTLHRVSIYRTVPHFYRTLVHPFLVKPLRCLVARRLVGPHLFIHHVPGEQGRLEPTETGRQFLDLVELVFVRAKRALYLSVAMWVVGQTEVVMMLNDGKLDVARILGRRTVETLTMIPAGESPILIPGPWSGFGLSFGITRNIDTINTLAAGQPIPSPWSVDSFW